MKSLKFKNELVTLILSGKKTSTWRLFDDKDLQVGDELVMLNKDTGEQFGTATIISTYEKRLCDLTDADFEGHEKFESEEKMYEAYRSYYGNKVNRDSILKIVNFRFKK